MYKQVMLLGLLVEKPMYGQQIREVIENHHDLFAEAIKKPTIYYQLERLAVDGYLEVRREAVEAPGPGSAHDALALRERDVYYITNKGREHFYQLLQQTLCSYDPGAAGVDAALYFVHHLEPEEATRLLQQRYALVSGIHRHVVEQLSRNSGLDAGHRLISERHLVLIEAELAWLNRAIEHFQRSGRPVPQSLYAVHNDTSHKHG